MDFYVTECWLLCQNQGRCIEEKDVYRCWCQEQFYGSNRENKDECFSDRRTNLCDLQIRDGKWVLIGDSKSYLSGLPWLCINV